MPDVKQMTRDARLAFAPSWMRSVMPDRLAASRRLPERREIQLEIEVLMADDRAD